MKPAVARWLEFAETERKAARALLKEGSLSPVVCFHAQQSVEKCLFRKMGTLKEDGHAGKKIRYYTRSAAVLGSQ
jgi:HEPN domain-containing protein